MMKPDEPAPLADQGSDSNRAVDHDHPVSDGRQGEVHVATKPRICLTGGASPVRSYSVKCGGKFLAIHRQDDPNRSDDPPAEASGTLR
jgi:hypothetical protein